MKELLLQAKPFLDFIYDLIQENKEKEDMLIEVRGLAKKYLSENSRMNDDIQKLRIENHNLQLFIEENVDEETKKKIFKA